MIATAGINVAAEAEAEVGIPDPCHLRVEAETVTDIVVMAAAMAVIRTMVEMEVEDTIMMIAVVGGEVSHDMMIICKKS